MSTRNRILLGTLGLLTGLCLAAGGVAADGNTIAGSAKAQTLASPFTRVLLAGLGGRDVCATIVNRSEKNATVEITLTDDGAGTSTAQVPKSKSLALCGIDTDEVSVACLGPNKCAFTWDVSRF